MRFVVLAALIGCAHPREFGAPELVYAWSRVTFDQPIPDDVSAKTLLAGVHVDHRGTVYVSTPRWLDARVPATLSRVVVQNGAPMLVPVPSREANALGAPGALQDVLGFAIDSKHRMWILDMGWVAGVDPTPDGAEKLVVIDLDTGKEVARYAFPDSVADRKTSFLNDLAIDERRGLAYISDSGNRSGSPTASGIIIYDLASNTARRVLDRDPHLQDDPARTLVVAGEPVFPGNRLAVGINGIALSPDGERLYWSITTGDAIYDAKAAELRDPHAQIHVHGPQRIGGGSDGITVDKRGRVYVTNLAASAVQVLDHGTTKTIASGPAFAWPDTLAWDDHGRLYVSTNHLNHGFAGTLDFTQTNFRIFRITQGDPR